MMQRFAILAALSSLLAAPAVLAACPDAEAIQRYVEDWQAKKPTKALPVASLEDAACARDKLVQALGASQGKVVGHKAGLTAKAVQERFNANAPVSGVLLERMIFRDGPRCLSPSARGASGKPTCSSS
jgi:2-keto-4-pentenoate hydratase